MSTMTVKDSAGADQTVEKPLTPGRAAAASSRPVVLSTEDLAALASQTKQDALAALVGEVQASPTSNTLLDRLKQIFTALGSPMQSSGGSVALVAQSYTATATFTPAAAAYSANDIMDVAKEMTWVDKDGVTFAGGEMMITSVEMTVAESAIQSGETSYSLQKSSAARAVPLADNDASTTAIADVDTFMYRTDLGSPVDRGGFLAVKTNSVNEQITVPTTGKIVAELVTNGGFTATATARKVTLHGMPV